MQCRHCGSIIRDNVKYCTMCGKSVFEIRNSIINNETTDKMKEQVVNVGNKVADNVKNVSNKVAENIKSIDTYKMKEQFRNVSNNVVENVKNFDKEQAKQKTMNFASNVKTDVKNFKTLSTTKKRNYIIALVVIILVVFVAGKGILGIGGSKNSDMINSGTKDSAIVAEAFKKWIDTDTEANLLYNNNDCIWEGKVGARSENTIFVNLTLYDKKIYNQLKNLGQDTSGAKLLSGTVRMPKK